MLVDRNFCRGWALHILAWCAGKGVRERKVIKLSDRALRLEARAAKVLVDGTDSKGLTGVTDVRGSTAQVRILKYSVEESVKVCGIQALAGWAQGHKYHGQGRVRYPQGSPQELH